MKRTSVVELVVDGGCENKLKLFCSLSSKLLNEVNYARRRFYEKYKTLIESATAQQILNKNDRS